jgi:hypothetical protein
MKSNKMQDTREMDELVDIINSVFEVDVKKKSGKREYVDARYAFSKIMTDRGYSITLLSNYIKKHHSTIIYYRNSACDLLETNDIFLGKYIACRDKFLSGKGDTIKISNKEELINQIDTLILEKSNLQKRLEKYKRLDNIIEFIDSRTPKGKESFMLRKINLMINGLTDYGQELEW